MKKEQRFGKKEIIFGALGILLILGGIIFFTGQGDKPDIQAPLQESKTETTLQNQQQIHEIQITSTGFVPKTFTIKQGEAVRWTNTRSEPSWPASAAHPSHAIYPGSSIEKCETAEQNAIFDACKGLAQGESYTFTFNEVGSWNYHDHLIPSQSGRIIVEP